MIKEATLLSSATINITDPVVLQKAKSMAETAGRRDWRVWLSEQATRATKGLLGLSCDLTPKEAAAYLGVHKNTVFNYIKCGMLPHTYWASAHKVLIPMADLEAVKQRTAKAA